jgi:hypothetical protein
MFIHCVPNLNLKQFSKFPLALKGVLATGSVHSTPHRHELKFSGTGMCRINFKHLTQPLKS